MENLKKSECLKLLPIAALLIITPLVSTSLRSKYLYFIANILIIALGAEAGLLSFFLQSPQPKKPIVHEHLSPINYKEKHSRSPDEEKPDINEPVNAVEKCEKINYAGATEENNIMKKSPSSPSIFFIEEAIEENEGEQIGDMSGQELFHKAETFIGDFYKQLKIQREESWKKLHLHDLSQKAF